MRWPALLLCVGLGLSACKKKKTAPPRAAAVEKGYPLQVVDDRGRSITIGRKPQRMVVGGTALYTEILLDLQAHPRLVALSDSPNHPKALAHLPRVGRPWPLNVERVLSFRPDIVFCAMAKARQKLEATRITVFTGGQKGQLPTVEAIFALIRQMDRIVHGEDSRSKALIGRMRRELARLARGVQGRPWVSAAILYMPKPQGSRLYAIGSKGSPASELLRRARGRNVFGKGGLTNIEALLKRDPQVLITDPKHVQRILKHRALASLKAVRGKRVVGIPASHYTSSRVTRAFKQLLQALHPKAPQLPKAP